MYWRRFFATLAGRQRWLVVCESAFWKNFGGEHSPVTLESVDRWYGIVVGKIWSTRYGLYGNELFLAPIMGCLHYLQIPLPFSYSPRPLLPRRPTPTSTALVPTSPRLLQKMV